jgi:hypothetical protein
MKSYKSTYSSRSPGANEEYLSYGRNHINPTPIILRRIKDQLPGIIGQEEDPEGGDEKISLFLRSKFL